MICVPPHLHLAFLKDELKKARIKAHDLKDDALRNIEHDEQAPWWEKLLVNLFKLPPSVASDHAYLQIAGVFDLLAKIEHTEFQISHVDSTFVKVKWDSEKFKDWYLQTFHMAFKEIL